MPWIRRSDMKCLTGISNYRIDSNPLFGNDAGKLAQFANPEPAEIPLLHMGRSPQRSGYGKQVLFASGLR
jgi:hypothetical protein